MAIIRPFRALRPKPRLAKRVASRPYDVLNSTEARLEASGNPDSFLHITKSEIDLPETVDSHSQEVYDKAKENLIAFEQQEILFREEKPCYYIYMLTMNGKSQTGLVCLSSLDDYEQDIIRKHETTRPDKELDRINHILTTRAQTGNVFLAYKTDQRIHQAVEDWKASHHPDYDFTADDGVKHLVWVIHDEESMNRLTTWFGDHVPFTYIADGHHRAASADKVRAALGKNSPQSASFFLTILFPSD
jgi:uncharacterized protein (DUF1015 family)